MVRRKHRVKVTGESDSYSITPEKDNKRSEGSGINIVSTEKLDIPSNKPTTTANKKKNNRIK